MLYLENAFYSYAYTGKEKEHQQKLQAIYDTYTHSDPVLIEKYSKSIFIVLEETYFIAKQFLYSLLSIVYGKNLLIPMLEELVS